MRRARPTRTRSPGRGRRSLAAAATVSHLLLPAWAASPSLRLTPSLGSDTSRAIPSITLDDRIGPSSLKLERELRTDAPEAARRRPAAAPPPAVYVDKLIAGSVDSESEIVSADNTPGRRILSAGYRVEMRQPATGGHGFEHGVDAQYRFETINYGEFFIDSRLRHSRRAPGEPSIGHSSGGRFTLYQNAFPITSALIADSAVGVVRTPPSTLFNQSYRIFLPTSLIAGASTVLATPVAELRAFAGSVGRLEGTFSQGFNLTSGRLAGFGATSRLGPATVAGVHWLQLRGGAEVPDHDSLTAAVEFAPNTRRRLKAQALVSDNGKLGLWVDTDWITGRWRQRFGGYHLDPDVLWADTTIVNDNQGLYWRIDHVSLRETVSFGADAIRSNVDGDPARRGGDTLALYATNNLRIDRALSVGVGLTAQHVRPRTALSTGGASLSANAYASRLTTWGITRLDVSKFLTRPDSGPHDNILGITLSQDFGLPWQFSGSATIAYSRDHSNGLERQQTSAGVTVRGPGVGPVTWDASAVVARVTSDAGDERNVNLSLNAFWPISRNWTAHAQFARNAIDPVPTAMGAPPLPFQKDQRLQLGVRYDLARGIPYVSAGMSGGRGTGSITGVVFFDENGDGQKQPTERGAAQVIVYLDGRFPATTDAEGRFTFPAVPAGPHSIRVLAERMPLPWALDDDAPRVVNVPVRGEATTAIGLTRLRR